MAYSYQSEVSDGTLQRVVLSIAFYNKEDIKVYVGGVLLNEAAGEYHWESDIAVYLRDVVPAGVSCTLRRDTDMSKLRLKFSEGVPFTRKNLDDQNTQFLHMGQESIESAISDIYGDVDMHQFRIRNAGDPILDRDYTTKGWVARTYAEAVRVCIENADYAAASAKESLKYSKDALASAARAEAAAAVVGPQVREALRRSYTDTGYNLVDGSFEDGGVLSSTVDVLLHETSGHVYTGPIGPVPAGTDPHSGGFTDVSDKLNAVSESVAALKSLHVIIGGLYKTKGYYYVADGGAAEYLAMPAGAATADGYGDHVANNGVVLQLVSPPTDLNHGVTLGDTYNATVAWHNRNALQNMLRNPRFSNFSLVADGTYYVLGSVHPLRSSISINHNTGCNIRGRYNDPSIPNSLVSQSGSLFGFVSYRDPDNGDFTVGDYLQDIKYTLDGDVMTEFNSGHYNQYNNNCIGFYKVKESSVRGLGGVSRSDHRGVNFDGDAINCHIDIGYVSGTMDEPLVMKSSNTVGNMCTVKVGRVYDVPFGGPNAPIVVRCEGGFTINVDIGSFVWDGATKPQLVGAFACNVVNVNSGYVDGASQLFRQYDTKVSDVVVAHVRNTPWGIVRAGTTANSMQSAKLHGIQSIDTVFTNAYRSENNRDTFRVLDIFDNNFRNGPTTFQYYADKRTVSLPDVYNLHDNISPRKLTVSDCNTRTYSITGNLLSKPAVTSATVNYKEPDWNYGKMSVITQAGGVNSATVIDLRTRDLTSTPVIYYAGAGTLTTTKSGGTLTLTCAGCTLQLVTMYN